MHTGHLKTKLGSKMSKSDNTGLTLETLGCPPDAFRWWCLAESGGAREDSVFEERRVGEARGKLEAVRALFRRGGGKGEEGDLRAVGETEAEIRKEMAKRRPHHEPAKVLKRVYELAREAGGWREGDARRRAAKVCRGVLEVAGFTEWVTEPEKHDNMKVGPPAGGEQGEDMEAILREFRGGVRETSLRGLKSKDGGEKNTFKELLKLCDGVRDKLGGVEDGKVASKPAPAASLPEAEGLDEAGNQVLPKDYFRKSAEYAGTFSDFDGRGMPGKVKDEGGVWRELTGEEREKMEEMKERYKVKWWGEKSMRH